MTQDELIQSLKEENILLKAKITKLEFDQVFPYKLKTKLSPELIDTIVEAIRYNSISDFYGYIQINEHQIRTALKDISQ